MFQQYQLFKLPKKNFPSQQLAEMYNKLFWLLSNFITYFITFRIFMYINLLIVNTVQSTE